MFAASATAAYDQVCFVAAGPLSVLPPVNVVRLCRTFESEHLAFHLASLELRAVYSPVDELANHVIRYGDLGTLAANAYVVERDLNSYCSKEFLKFHVIPRGIGLSCGG